MIKLPDDVPDMLNLTPEQQTEFNAGFWYAVEKIKRLNATAQPVSDGWLKCSERMPEADGHYLVFANASTLDGYCDHNDIACYQQGKWSNEFNWLVTHWMPLPAAPGGQGD